MKNMIDHCHQAHLFFRNSPKRQRLFEHVIKCLCPESKRSKINGLYKTRWVKRHNTYSSFFELYPYLGRTWNEICHPSDDESLYDEINDWNWESESRTLANGLLNIFVSFQHTIVFILAKELLEPIRPIAECLQGRLQEVYFGFQKVSEVKQHYQALREDVDKEHDRIHQKALLLTDKIGGEERMPCIIPGRQSRPNPEVQSTKDYWSVTATIPFLDFFIITELESRFGSEKRGHYELCVLIPEVLREVEREKVSAIASVPQLKLKHLMPHEDTFDSDLFCWKNHCKGLKEPKSITRLLCEDADPVFFPNVP